MVLVVAASVIAGGCDRTDNKKSSQTSAQPNGTKKEWTPAEIAKDPQGYLTWSDRQVAQQIAEREAKLSALAERRSQLEEKQRMLDDNIKLMDNFHNRLATAYQQAEDEDRWPVKVAGQTLERSKAAALLKRTEEYVKERRPMEGTYDQLFAKLDVMDSSLRKDITELKQLREKMALDLENVRLNQENADVEKLRATQSQLARISSTVSAMSNDPLAIQAPTEPPGRVSIDDLLK